MEIREKFLPYAEPYWDKEELEKITKTIESNWWSKGPQTQEFEKQFAEFVGAKYAIAVNSCTAATHAILATKNLQPGDEVIVPAMTFCSTANVVVHCGATPVFADVDERTGLIDPQSILAHITDKTRGIIPVHYSGQACDMDVINAIAKEHGLFVVEDAAHAVYTTYKGKMVGGLGNPTAFSFYVTKNLATGEGGMITTDDEELADLLRVYTLHGMNRNAWNRYGKGGTWRYDVVTFGFKYNMTDIQASLGLSQLKKLPMMQEMRERYAKKYNEAFQNLPGIGLMDQMDYGRNAWHLYILRIEDLKIDRDQFIEELKALNIGTAVHFIPVHMHPIYRETFHTKEGDCPVAEKLFSQIISLPMNPSMTESDIDYVIQAVKYLAGKYAK